MKKLYIQLELIYTYKLHQLMLRCTLHNSWILTSRGEQEEKLDVGVTDIADMLSFIYTQKQQ